MTISVNTMNKNPNMLYIWPNHTEFNMKNSEMKMHPNGSTPPNKMPTVGRAKNGWAGISRGVSLTSAGYSKA